MKRLALALALSWLTAGAASAQPAAGEAGWPTRPIRLIVPFPPASTADVVARVLGQKLGARLGQQFVVDNRVGASGNIGVDLIAKAAPDGYTIGIVTSSTQAVSVTLSSSLPYDPIRDFTPIVMIASSPYVLVVYPGLPVKSVAELVALAKRKPGALNYGSAGPASLAHLAGALFATMTDLQITHVPYKSTAQSVIDMMGGRLDMQFATIPPSIQTIRAGQLRALAVTGKKRVEALPDTPTMAEAGVAGYDATLWFALVAPAKFPAGLAARLNREIAAVLEAPDMKELMVQQGLLAEAGPPEALTRTGPRRHREMAGGHRQSRDHGGMSAASARRSSPRAQQRRRGRTGRRRCPEAGLRRLSPEGQIGVKGRLQGFQGTRRPIADNLTGRMFRMRFLLRKTCLSVCVALAVAGAMSVPVWAGGSSFGDDDDAEDEGPAYFGFVRDTGGNSVRRRQGDGGHQEPRRGGHPQRRARYLPGSGFRQGRRHQRCRGELREGRLQAAQDLPAHARECRQRPDHRDRVHAAARLDAFSGKAPPRARSGAD